MTHKLISKNEAKKRIEKLKKTINRHRYLYHVLDRQEISDEVLDTLKKELFDLEQKLPDLVTPDSPTQRIAGKPLKQFKKVRHPEPMLSFNDAFDENDMKEWEKKFERVLSGSKQHGPVRRSFSEDGYYCELKIDGLAIELIYKKGQLDIGSTRGDGTIGEDVTQNLKTVDAIPLVLNPVLFEKGGTNEKKDVVVRGEVFITKNDFERINKEQEKAGLKIYANPRNLAAGSIRQLDPKITASRHLDSYAYSLITDFGQKTHEEEHQILRSLGFKINPHNKAIANMEGVNKFRNHWEKERGKLNYEIDGVVVILNHNNTLKRLGVVGKAPRGAIAYKFSPKESETVVENIIVQVGRTGVLTPVAVLRPVQIGGTTVSRATLHNLDEIKRLGVKIGDTVIVGRAGDVIPDIKKVLKELRTGKEKEFHMPKKCPVCEEPIEKIEGQVAYRCLNRDCPAIKREAIYHLVSRKALNMAGIGPRIIDQLMAAGLIRDSADLFSLKKEDLLNLERFADKSAENVVDAIQSKKKVALNKFIYSLGIDHVGEETGFVLAKKFKSLKNIEEVGLEELQNVSDIGPVIAQSIYNWFQKPYNKNILSKFKKAGVNMVEEKLTKKSTKLVGKTFVLTGTLESLGQNEAQDKIRELGGNVSSSISKNTDYVVAGSKPGSKYDQAERLKVKIIDEKEFLELIG